MGAVENIITDNLPVWSSAVQSKSSAGRGTSSKRNLYGVKKLRELILDLAVRGLLVPQDPNDEPTSVLLEKIAAEKERLDAEGKIKKNIQFSNVESGDMPFHVPKSWSWARLPSVCHYNVGKTPPTKNSSFWSEPPAGIPWVSIADMNHYGSIETTKKHVSATAVEKVFKYAPIKAGTILMSFKLTLGKIAKLAIDSFHNEAIISLYPFQGIFHDYLFYILPAQAQAGNSKAAIKGNTLNSESLAAILIPLPPLAEQHRIVAKVDELMALCDTLEQQQEDSIQAHETLVEALLEALTSAADADAFQSAWQRISEHFDVLFTTEHSIDKLKETILQLAVMGKLVPQDPNDEPASKALEAIKAKVRQIAANEKFTSNQVETEITDGQFDIPENWVWCKLNDLAAIARGGSPRPIKDFITDDSTGLNWIKIGDSVRGSRYIDSTEQKIRKEGLSRTREVHCGDLILSNSMSFGYPYIMRVNGCVHDGWLVLRLPNEKVDKLFIYNLFLSPYAKKCFSQSAAGAVVQNLNVVKVSNLNVALPPLAEQHRIVAKIDELIALCDQIRESLQQAQQTQIHLTDAVVEDAL